MARENKRQWPRTISLELHKAWMNLRRKGDPERMATDLQYSRPVIDRALKYGYISMPELTDKINNYFMKRLKKEQGTAGELMELANEIAKG